MLGFLTTARQLVITCRELAATQGELLTAKAKLGTTEQALEEAHRAYITADTQAGERMREMTRQHNQERDELGALVSFLCGQLLEVFARNHGGAL
ncbi:hypothetical protein ABZ883_04615 [Streptomyces sp. NPDC046977]|uniref:hypothetical protein n=1 Tax=Streptomyces sp. NPDC046977 TaxID=3154703 RepID=UPI0033D410F2